MKTILVPTDYSKQAKSAFWYALEMALVSKAEIVLVHAFHQPVFSPFPFDEEAMQAELESQRLQKLRNFAKEAADSFCTYFSLVAGTCVKAEAKEESFHDNLLSVYLNGEKSVPVTLACRYGLTEEEILKATRYYAADMIVMGMRGAGTLSQALLGSTTLAVIEESEVPVLAVPLEVRFSGLASLVLATDPARLPDATTLQPLCGLMAAFRSKLAVLQLYKDNTAPKCITLRQTASGKLKACLPGIDYKLYTSQGEDVAAGIQQFLEAVQADLLVLLPQRHTFLSRLLNRSITGKMAAKALVPLLALPGATANATAREAALEMA